MQSQVLEIQDFSGGITDNYVAGPNNKYQRADNCLIVPYRGLGILEQRPGSGFLHADAPRLPSGNQRVNLIYEFKAAGKTIVGSGRDIFYYTSSWQTLLGPTGNKVFPLGITADHQMTVTYWGNHILVASEGYARPAKIFPDGSGNLQARTAGLPSLTAPTVTAGAAGANNYLYRFAHSYSYAGGTITFEDIGPTTEVALTSAAAPNVSAVHITNIPVLSNGATLNYDTTTIKIQIFRTENNGTEFYKVGEVTNGTTTFNDSMSDATLVDGEPIYTSGGVVDNEAPPECKYVHVTEDNVGIYANVRINGEIFSNRLLYSIPGDIDSVPSDFFEEVDEEILGISSLNSRVIVFCRSSVWSLDGFFDALGKGVVVKRKIGDVTGCVSSGSIVKTVEGIFFAGDAGFYFTDGTKVAKISEGIDETYMSFTDSTVKKTRINGSYDALRRRVWWGVQMNSSSNDADSCMILHLSFGIKIDMPFTTASGGDNFRPSAIAFVQNNLIRGDSRGYVFQHSDDVDTDLKVEPLVATDDWATTTVIFDHKSCAYNYGTDYLRKWVPRISCTLKNESNISVQINSINDDGRNSHALTPIRYRGNIIWGDPDILWGTPGIIWNFFGLIIEQRRFPATSLRCSYKQVQFTNAKVPIVSSDLYGIGDIDATAKTLTLTDAGDYAWPPDPVDYYLSFEEDNYQREFLITSRTSDTVLAFSDTFDFSDDAVGSKWVLRGYPKKEFFSLLSYTMGYSVFGQTQNVFNQGESGEVASSV